MSAVGIYRGVAETLIRVLGIARITDWEPALLFCFFFGVSFSFSGLAEFRPNCPQFCHPGPKSLKAFITTDLKWAQKKCLKIVIIYFVSKT